MREMKKSDSDSFLFFCLNLLHVALYDAILYLRSGGTSNAIVVAFVYRGLSLSNNLDPVNECSSGETSEYL